MIKIVIVDDQKMLSHSLKIVFEEEETIKVIGCVESVEGLMELLRAEKPDVILMDLMLPETSGIEGARYVKAMDETIKVIMLTGNDEMEYLYNSIRSGVDGYVLKSLLPEELINVIKSVYSGMEVISQPMYKRLMERYILDSQELTEKVSLTPREQDILKLVVRGMSNGEIADDLNLSEGTVRNIVSELLSKFDVKNRVNLAVKAMNSDLLV